MDETWNWDDLRLFLAVARASGLAKAAPMTRVSAPTLSRRMTSLERALGGTLFLRHRNGYDLTTAGKELLELAEEYNLPVDVPFRDLNEDHLLIVQQGVPEREFGGLQ